MALTEEECLTLLQEYHVPEHIIQHSRVVHRLALSLCRALNGNGERLDCAKVAAGSLLHDIAKMESMNTEENHSRAGAALLSRLGYPEVAEIVRQHVILDDGTPQDRITEVELVHYADKRAQHTAVVSLGERFRDLKERYGKSPEALAWLEDLERKSLRLEERIFQRLPIKPELLDSFSSSA
jgi:putative nucleotidyltransferase with HDIG domain